MTTLDNPDNIVLDSGGSNEVTINTTNVREVRQKMLEVVPRAVGKSSRGGTVLPPRVLDLLRVERRFTFRGLMDKTDKSKLDNLFEQGGPTTALWDSVSYTVNIEKFEYEKDDRDSSERDITITFIEGSDL